MLIEPIMIVSETTVLPTCADTTIGLLPFVRVDNSTGAKPESFVIASPEKERAKVVGLRFRIDPQNFLNGFVLVAVKYAIVRF